MNNLAYKIAIASLAIGLVSTSPGAQPTVSRYFITRSVPAHDFSQTGSVKNARANQPLQLRAGLL